MKNFFTGILCLFFTFFLKASQDFPEISKTSSKEELLEFLTAYGGSIKKNFLFYFDLPTESIFKTAQVELQNKNDIEALLEYTPRELNRSSDDIILLGKKFNLLKAIYSHHLLNLRLFLNPLKTYTKNKKHLARVDLETNLPLEDHERRFIIEAKINFSYTPTSITMTSKQREEALKWEEKFLNFLRIHSKTFNEIAKQRTIVNYLNGHFFLESVFQLGVEYFRFITENWDLRTETPGKKNFATMAFSIQSGPAKNKDS